ncbi:uncharacterized protein EV422DRAFT_500729 [Fimicolochytrium jonesii]|uniref:uncharacterized protein n=1 Tax=Fimicolochytrium jonesii TaxID=1396493 RepID=UPI0022FE8BB3|nr:uncharacterized protein EV422DRAFT_500729 [Fimicolochytrium jonesii]KAI8816867.1 hypothetical protein EV422DRAFT_500729 [Fimicolochytrium jonesii]
MGGITKSNRFAVLAGQYGAGRGPFAYTHARAENQEVGTGTPPVVFTLPRNQRQAQTQLTQLLRENECCGLLVEMVNSGLGETLQPALWSAIITACAEAGCFLCVDEAMTAIRCGAPFAHQRPEYVQHGHPDLIVFGKALVASGVAMDLQGRTTCLLSAEAVSHVLFLGRSTTTLFCQTTTLLQLRAVLHIAVQHDFVGNATKISDVLRSKILSSAGSRKRPWIGGLGSLLYMKYATHESVDISRTIIPASATPGLVRWIPPLDLDCSPSSFTTSHRKAPG